MSDELDMHSKFLAKLIARREQLSQELEELLPVEAYHRRAVEELAPAREHHAVSNGHASGKLPPDTELLDLNRHDACELALKQLGGMAKTQEIADWLQLRGYGTEFDKPRVFHNTCYTAMVRKKDRFEKLGPGSWKLIGQ